MFIDAMRAMRFYIVDFYLARQLLTGIVVALLALLAIDGVVDFLDEIDKVNADYPIGTMLFYSLLEIAISAYELLPIAVLLGCLVGLGSMAINFEFLALRACGYTRVRIAYSILVVGALLMIGTFIYGDLVVPKAQYQQYQIRHCCEQRSHFFESDSGYWLREGDHFVNFKTLLNDDEYLDVNVFELNRNYRLLRHVKAKRAVASIDERILILHDAELFLFGKENRIQKRIAERLQIPFMISELTNTMPESLKQEHMNFRQLYVYIQFLKRSELNTDVHELALWTRLSTMLSILVVILLAIPWIFGSVQSAAMGKRFFTAVLLGLTYIIASQIFGNLSISYHFPAWLGAFLPVILFSLLGFYLLRVIR